MNIFATFLSAVLNTSLGFLVLAVFTSEARLPPKFVKAANGAGKALYATRYGYTTVPVPPQIMLQTNLARKEVHLGGTGSRVWRPSTRRQRRRPEYAGKYQEYIPNIRSQKKKSRGPRPPKRRPSKHRPSPYKEPEYYDQEDIDEDYEESEYEYEERPWKHNKEYDDFIGQHSKLHSTGYHNNRAKRNKKRGEEEGAYSEHPSPVYARKPKTYVKNWAGSTRPTNKLYSSTTAGLSTRPSYIREEERHKYEEDNEERRHRYKEKQKRYRIKEEDRYIDQEEEGYHRDNGRNRYDSHRDLNGHREGTYENKQKRRERGVKSNENSNSKGKRNSQYRERDWVHEKDKRSEWDEEDDEKLVRPSREKDNYWKSRDYEEKRNYDQDNESKGKKYQQNRGEKLKNDEEKKWSVEDDGKNKRQEADRNKNTNKEVTETQISPQVWSTQLPSQLSTWKDTHFHVLPSITPILLSSELPITWGNQFNQQNWNKPGQTTIGGRWLDDPFKLNSRITEHTTGELNDESWKTQVISKLNNIREEQRVIDKEKNNNEDNVTIAQRVVGATFGWKPENIRAGEITDIKKWNTQNFPQVIENKPNLQPFPLPNLNPPKWTQTNLPQLISQQSKRNQGDIVYGSRIKDEQSKNKESDIGFGQGMEVFDNIGGWQVY